MSDEFWVFFEKDTGIIKKISGKKETTKDLSSISVPYEQVKDIYEGKKNFNNFFVEYNVQKKEYTLRVAEEKVITFLKFLEIDNKIKNPEILIIQDIKKKNWEIKIHKQLAKKFQKEKLYSHFYVSFSITKKGNPHILYRFLKIDLYSLVNELHKTIPFDTIHETEEVSLFTSKTFESYTHKVKK